MTITVYNVAGEVIWTDLFSATAGKNARPWAGTNMAGAKASSGVYLIGVHALGNNGSEDTFFEHAAIVR